MNYKDDDNKIPFYMTYPMQNMYLAEMEYEKDMERMKELYPREVRRIQEMIEKHCDEMEHEASRMYDENPDRQMMEEEARRIYERFLRENPQYRVMSDLTLPMTGTVPQQSGRPMEPQPMPPRPGRPMEPQPMPPRLGRPMEPQPMPPRPDRPMEPYPMPPRPGRPMEPQPMPSRPMPRVDDMLEMRDDIQMQQYGRNADDRWLRSLIHIMFHDEVYRRRCRNRRCRRWW